MEISRKRMVAGTLASTGLAAALFLGGAWTASSGILALGPTPASTSSDDSCCDKPMPPGEMGPNMHKHGGMSPGEKDPNMPMEPGKPMPKSDKMCCEKH